MREYRFLRDKSYSRAEKLLELVAPLERKVRNIFQETLKAYNLLFLEGKKGRLRQQAHKIQRGQDVSNFKFSTYETVKDYFFHRNKEKFDEFKQLKEELTNIENNYLHAIQTFEIFYETGIVNYLQDSINLLQGARKLFLSFKSPLTNFKKDCIPYFSRNRFCAYSNTRKITETKALLMPALTKYTLYDNFRISFITFAPKNILKNDFSKEDPISFGLVLKNALRHRLSLKRCKEIFKKGFSEYEERVKKAYEEGELTERQYQFNLYELAEIFPKFLKERPSLENLIPGYFRVLEFVEESTEINMHAHFIALRDSAFDEGFISKFYLEEVFKECCNIWGNSNLKGSSIVDIRSHPSPKERDDISNVAKAVDYVLVNYMLKGAKIESKEVWKDFIVATDGVRFEASAGILAKNKLKQIAVDFEVERKLNNYFKGLVTDFDDKHFLFGGKKKNEDEYILDPVSVDKTSFMKLRSQGFSIEQIKDRSLYYYTSVCSLRTRKERVIQAKTAFYRKVQFSLFGKLILRCPFSKDKLQFNRTTDEKFETIWKDPFFVSDALNSLYKKHKNWKLEKESRKVLEYAFGPKKDDVETVLSLFDCCGGDLNAL